MAPKTDEIREEIVPVEFNPIDELVGELYETLWKKIPGGDDPPNMTDPLLIVARLAVAIIAPKGMMMRAGFAAMPRHAEHARAALAAFHGHLTREVEQAMHDCG